MAGPTIDATGTPNTFSSARNVSATGLTVSASGTAILAWLEFTNAAPGTVTVSWNFTGTTQTMTLLTSSTVAGTSIRLYGLINPTVGNKRLSASWGVTGSGILTAMSFAGTFTGSTSGTGTSAFPNPAAIAPTAQTTTVTINGVPGDYTAIGAATGGNPITFSTNSSVTRFVTSSAGGAIAPLGQFPQANWSVSMPSSAAVAIVSTDVSGPGSSITQYWMRPESSDFSIDSGPFATYPSWTAPLNAPPSLQNRTLSVAVSSQLYNTQQPPAQQQGVSIGWDQPLAVPYLRTQMPAAVQPVLAEPVAPPSLGIIGWLAPLSVPPAFLAPRALPLALRTQTYTAGPLPIIPPTPFFAAFRPFSEPPPPIPKRAVFMPPATGPPANYAYDRWFPSSLSTPPAHLSKPTLITAAQQAHVEPITAAAIPPPPVTLNVHPGLNAWASGNFVLGQRCSSFGGAYQCTTPGFSTTAPGGGGGGAVTLDPANTGTDIVLSSGNFVATKSAAGVSAFEVSRATASVGPGKYYFEFSQTVMPSPGFSGVGLSNASLPVNSFGGGSVNGVNWINDGRVFFNNSVIATINGTNPNDVISFAFDVTAGLLWVKNVTQASFWNNSAGANPATGVGGINIGVTGALFPTVMLHTGDAGSINFGASAFGGTVPSGFSSLTNTAVFKFLSNIDYTSLQAAANAIMNTYAVGGLTANQVVLNWNDTPLTAPINGAILQYYGIASNGFTTTFTCAPGESFRDGAGGNPLTFNAAAGVSFDAPATGTESNASLYVYINVANVIFDGLQFRNLNPTGDTASGDILIGIDTSGVNFTFQNGILDGRSLLYFSTTNCSVFNSLLINQQTNNPASPQWPVKYDVNATGKVVNCTCVGFNPTGGIASMVTTTGIGPVNITNCAAFGLPDPFFCQNTGGSIIVDHCVTSVASFSTGDGCTDAGGNLFNKNIANQFINQANNFRLKAGADCINAGRTDTVDIPSALDIFRTSRPQAGAWDIGAFEFVFPLVWLSALSGEVQRQQARTPGQMGGYTAPVSIAAEATSLDRYHQPLSRVPPGKPGLLPHLTQAYAAPITTPAKVAEATTVDRWLPHYPEMARGRAIHPSATPSFFAPTTTIFTEVISRDRWTPTYPDRVPGRAIHPSVVPFATFAPVSPVFRETTSLDRWYSPLSMPQLWRTTFREQATATEAWIAVQTIPVAKNFLPTVGSVVIQGYGPRIRRKPDLPHA